MCVKIAFHAPGSRVGPALTSAQWHSERFDFWAFDRDADERCARGEPLHVIAAAEEVIPLRTQVAIRTQRLAAPRNKHSHTRWFTSLLAEHRALHDLGKPHARADLDHAIDTWQWALRLDGEAPAALQIAALLRHLSAGMRAARSVLVRAAVPASIAGEACELIAEYGRVDRWASRRALYDADALSFFSFASPRYLAQFGREQTGHKVADTCHRMSGRARNWLDAVRMPGFVREQIALCEQ
jgi:hypothetical protein